MSTLQHRAGPLAGLAFAVLYTAFGLSPLMDLPEGASTDQQVIALVAEGGSRTGIVLGGALVGLSGVAMLMFLADLRRRLAVGAPDSSLPALAFGAGLIYVAMLFLAGNAWTGYATGIAVGELPVPQDATLLRVLSDSGFGLLLIYGLLAAATCVVATSLSARRTGLLSKTLTTSGFVIAAILCVGFTYVPQFLVPLWVIAISIALLRQPPQVSTGQTGGRILASPR
ncbi:MAG: hypothetical protein M3353_03105 [Actinomycetota bacterium]|nr:hypothetical protein [Actinomycetota bacterium]